MINDFRVRFEERIPLIRLISIFGIILVHTYTLIAIKLNFCNKVFFPILIISKSATFSFFIISGYLFQKKSDSYVKLGFLRYVLKKSKSIILPFLLIVYFPYLIYFKPQNLFNIQSSSFFIWIIKFLIHSYSNIIYSEYWFIIVLLIYLLMNYFLGSKYLRTLIVFSAIVTIIYSIRIEFKLTNEPSHTSAIFAYLFFFLIGRYLYNNSFILSIKPRNIFILIVSQISLLLGTLIYITHNNLDLNTLRFGVILNSTNLLVLVFYGFIKYSNAQIFKFKLNVRYHYFIFLTHIYSVYLSVFIFCNLLLKFLTSIYLLIFLSVILAFLLSIVFARITYYLYSILISKTLE